MCCVLCVLRYGVCWSLSFSLFPLSYLCGVLYNMIVHDRVVRSSAIRVVAEHYII